MDLAADNFMITEERLALYEMTDDFNVREIEGDEVFWCESSAVAAVGRGNGRELLGDRG